MNITDEQIERFIVAHERIGNGMYAIARTFQDADQNTIVDALYTVAQEVGDLARKFSSNTPSSLASELSGAVNNFPVPDMAVIADSITEAAGIIAKSLDGKAKAA